MISKPTSRNRPIVARLNGLTDSETGHYTVKLYDTEKKPGGWTGKLFIAKDFDAPLPDEIQSVFEGRE